LFLTLFFRLEN